MANVKLTPTDIIRIRELLAQKVNPYVIAQSFGVGKSTIYNLKSKSR